VRPAAALAVAVAAAAAVLLVPVLAGRGGGSRPPTALTVATTLAPRAHLFGDRVGARVNVALDPRRIDPRSLAIETSFAPYVTVGEPRIVREPTSVRLEATLVCLARACVTKAPQRALTFPPARVRFRDRSGRAYSVQASWPPLLAASRLTPADVLRPQVRVDGELPPVSTAVDPTAAGWALAATAAALLLAAGGALARRLRLRPQPVSAEPVAREVPALVLALARVERLADESDSARRSALDRLARELDRAGLALLARGARALAWSTPAPSAEPMQHLSADVQKAVDAA
jgi:hypothetical protein